MIYQVMLLIHSVGERDGMGPLAKDFDYVFFFHVAGVLELVIHF